MKPIEERRDHNRMMQEKYRKEHPEKFREYWKEWRKKNPEKTKKYQKRWQDANTERVLNVRMRRVFGITLEEYNSINLSQGWVCAICGKKDPCGRRLAIDHDHKSGNVRGLLCSRCNIGAGMFNDNIELLEKLIKYLKINEKN